MHFVSELKPGDKKSPCSFFYRAVLEFAGRIAFGVDVGDFLELARAFERDRGARAAAEIEHVAGFRQIARELLARATVNMLL
jgi:hypothetical protein